MITYRLKSPELAISCQTNTFHLHWLNGWNFWIHTIKQGMQNLPYQHCYNTQQGEELYKLLAFALIHFFHCVIMFFVQYVMYFLKK